MKLQDPPQTPLHFNIQYLIVIISNSFICNEKSKVEYTKLDLRTGVERLYVKVNASIHI